MLVTLPIRAPVRIAGLNSFFNENGRRELRYVINAWVRDEHGGGREVAKKSLVVLLYKKDDPEDMENHRPTLLLNVLYNIVPILIKRRLQEVLESKLHNTQYGSTPGRGTAEAIHAIRRIVDQAEATDQKPDAAD